MYSLSQDHKTTTQQLIHPLKIPFFLDGLIRNRIRDT